MPKAIERSLYEDITQALPQNNTNNTITNQTNRIKQGITLYKEDKVKIHEVNHNLIKFIVTDHEGIRHDVRLEHGKIWTCDCPDHSFRLSFCAEIYAAILFLAVLGD